MIIVDNTIASFACQMENGIYIPTYTGQDEDNELEVVGNFLASIANVEDVRPHVKRFCGLTDLYEGFLSTYLVR